jgi:hypothetical protein
MLTTWRVVSIVGDITVLFLANKLLKRSSDRFCRPMSLKTLAVTGNVCASAMQPVQCMADMQIASVIDYIVHYKLADIVWQ